MTDWKLIKNLVNATIDACEAAENLGIQGEDKSREIEVNGQQVTIWDFLQSYWTYPENLKDSIAIARHKIGEDRKFTSEIPRSLQKVGMLISELHGIEDLDTKVSGVDPFQPEKEISIRELVENLEDFYKNHCIPNLKKAMVDKKMV